MGNVCIKRRQEWKSKDVVVLGVQPAFIEIGPEFSQDVQPAIDYTVKKAIDVLDSWGINCLTPT